MRMANTDRNTAPERSQTGRTEWTEHETELLARYYPDMDAETLVLTFLPGKTARQAARKAGRMGLRKSPAYIKAANASPRKNTWTQAEDDVLRANYGALGPAGIQPMLPRRTYQAVQARAGQLGLTSPRRKDMTEKKEGNPMTNKTDANSPGYEFFPARATVDLGYLVEDWQMLVNAIAANDWDSVRVTADCIAELIQSSRHDNPDLKFQPSASSMVAQGIRAGILAKPDGTDFECAAGLPMHEVIISETPQCPDGCAEKHGCAPEYCRIKMACGHVYDGKSMSADELLKALEKSKD